MADFHLGHFGGVGHEEIHEVGVARISLLVEFDAFVMGAADALRDAAQDLPLDQGGIDHIAAIMNADIALEVDRAEAGIDFDDRRMHAVSPGGMGR